MRGVLTLVFISLAPQPSLLQISNRFSEGCDKGEVRDLDGTCVKKVPFPTSITAGKRRSCPEPEVTNGHHFLRREGRMIEYFCNTEFIRVPDIEMAICRITGDWSKQVPVCLKSGCQEPVSPENGAVLLEYASSLATFSCDPGYDLQGEPFVGCVDGENWNSSMPFCQKITTTTTTTTPRPDQKLAQKELTNKAAKHGPFLSYFLVILCLVVKMNP
eukprot:TRINITY_DN32244_c0_g1_i1.p1 TRINITY_DN32244_c0_g1~~TRINITY_DN32244_c0_g1_i1.p1  ORF type:complete len:216 (+),score=9.54 TRINITY_DN32244_c0_g1_i1:44-691(+)